MEVTGNLIPFLIQFSLLLSRKGYVDLSPTKLREGSVFSHVYQSVCSGGDPIQDPDSTIHGPSWTCSKLFNLDVTIQGTPNLKTCSNLFTM